MRNQEELKTENSVFKTQTKTFKKERKTAIFKKFEVTIYRLLYYYILGF